MFFFCETLCIQSSNVFGKKKIFDFVINFLAFLYVSYVSAKFFTRMSKLYIFPITSYMSKLLKFFVYVRFSIELDEYNNTFINLLFSDIHSYPQCHVQIKSISNILQSKTLLIVLMEHNRLKTKYFLKILSDDFYLIYHYYINEN